MSSENMMGVKVFARQRSEQEARAVQQAATAAEEAPKQVLARELFADPPISRHPLLETLVGGKVVATAVLRPDPAAYRPIFMETLGLEDQRVVEDLRLRFIAPLKNPNNHPAVSNFQNTFGNSFWDTRQYVLLGAGEAEDVTQDGPKLAHFMAARNGKVGGMLLAHTSNLAIRPPIDVVKGTFSNPIGVDFGDENYRHIKEVVRLFMPELVNRAEAQGA